LLSGRGLCNRLNTHYVYPGNIMNKEAMASFGLQLHREKYTMVYYINKQET
jgi:hypothetical protein